MESTAIIDGPSGFIGRPVWQRAAASLAFVCAALGLTMLVSFLIDRPVSSPPFLGAIILSGWLCGWRAGLLASVLSAFAIDYFFVPPLHQFSGSFDDVARVSVFTAEGAIVCWLIEIRRSAVLEMRRTQERLRALTSRQQTLREDEQKRIALEIHDELGQALTGLKMDVNLLGRNLAVRGQADPGALVGQKLAEFERQIDGTIATIRRIATELRPSVLDDFGLVAAIEWQATEFSRKGSVQCTVSASEAELNISDEASTAVFRIVQEALTNVSRHANASQAAIMIELLEGNTIVTVHDDGVGIDLRQGQSRSLGIIGMRERARLIGATLDIFNGNGTTVRLTLPSGAPASEAMDR
jgi:signal transduction histidine kinase